MTWLVLCLHSHISPGRRRRRHCVPRQWAKRESGYHKVLKVHKIMLSTGCRRMKLMRQARRSARKLGPALLLPLLSSFSDFCAGAECTSVRTQTPTDSMRAREGEGESEREREREQVD